MPRPEHVERQLKGLKESNQSRTDHSVDQAYNLGYGEGGFMERQRLRAELLKYEADSVVAKLLLEKFQEE